MPTVNITTGAFLDLLLLEAEQRGLPDLRYVVVPHPIGGIQHDAVVEKARAALPDLIAALTGGDPTESAAK